MDISDILKVLIGIIIGVLIGYYFETVISPYTGGYSLSTTLTITPSTNSTTVLINQTVTFNVELDVIFPSELSSVESYLRPYILKGLTIKLYMNNLNSTYFWLIDTEETVYSAISGKGRATFTYTFETTGLYTVKAVFEGTNLLRASESEIRITVT